jgi:two-component system response regulator YesN
MSVVFSESIKSIGVTVNKFLGCNTVNSTIRKVCRYVLNNIESDISVKSISEELFINRNYLSDLFRHNIGISLMEYLTMVKMERAKRFLTKGNLKNYEIADKLGFKDIEYFSKVFKKYTGKTPTEFRNSLLLK